MTLPQAAPQRQFQHRHQIDTQVFSRGDGYWEIDAPIVDTQSRDTMVAGAVRAAGTPIHDMLLRLVVDAQLNVLDAGSSTRWMPYPGPCDEFGDQYGDQQVEAYPRLVGPNLLRGLRGEQAGSARPFQIDRCHALRSDGHAVRTHYPRWYRSAARATPATADLPTDRGPNR
jgi:hypothetical protein